MIPFSSRGDFEQAQLDESFRKGFGGRIIGIHLKRELFLLRSNDAGEMRVNHQEIQVGMSLAGPGGTLRDSPGGTLFHSELVAKRQTSIGWNWFSFVSEDVGHYFKFFRTGPSSIQFAC